MNQYKIDFLRDDFTAILRSADPATTPSWGKMNFQQMVEHMVLSLKNANGKLKVPNATPEDKIPAFKDFLMSEKEFRENTKSPSFPEEPLPLHFDSVQIAIDKLELEINHLVKVYESNPQLTIRNPVFGDLNFEEAIQLLYKHAIHHLKQFRLYNPIQ